MRSILQANHDLTAVRCASVCREIFPMDNWNDSVRCLDIYAHQPVAGKFIHWSAYIHKARCVSLFAEKYC